MDAMIPRLHDLYISCVGWRPKNIKEMMKKLPPYIWEQGKDPTLRPLILKYLVWLQAYYHGGEAK